MAPKTLISRGLAVFLPLLLAMVWLGPLADPFGSPDRAGMGEGRQQQPLGVGADVVVVGNSLAKHGVDPDLLARILGVERVDVIWERGSGPPLWYAALKNNLYAHGGHPELVIVVNPMSNILDSSLPEGRQLRDLRLRLTPDEPLLGAKIFGHTGPYGPLDRLMDNRRVPRDLYIDTLKRLGSSTPNDTLAEVFTDEKSAASKRVRVIPIVEFARSSPEDPDLEQSLLVDLIELAQQNGSKVVFATIPIAPSGREDWPAASDEDTTRAVALFEAQGAGFLDLNEVRIAEGNYLDNRHMNRDGQVLYTKALAAGIVQLGVLRSRPVAGASLPKSEGLGEAPSFRFLGGKKDTVRTVYERAEHPVEHADPVLGPDGVWAIALPDLEAVSIDGLRRLAVDEPGLSWIGKCSPVRVWEGTSRMMKGGSGPEGIAGGAVGMFRHSGDRVVFKPVDPSAHFIVTLSADRGCRAFKWIYPGDAVVYSLVHSDRIDFAASTLILGGVVFGAGAGQVTLSADGQVVLDRQIDLTDLAGDPLALALDRPLVSPPSEVKLAIRSLDDGPFVLLQLGLLEP